MFTGIKTSPAKSYVNATNEKTFTQYLTALNEPDQKIVNWSTREYDVNLTTDKNTQERILKTRDFRRRFGIERLIYKNNDMKVALGGDQNSPLQQEVEKINQAYDLIGWELADQYEKVIARLIELGYSDEEAKRRADEYIAPIVMAEIKLVKARHPFALGSGKGKKGPSMTDALYSRLKGQSLKPAPKAETGVDLSKVKTQPIELD